MAVKPRDEDLLGRINILSTEKITGVVLRTNLRGYDTVADEEIDTDVKVRPTNTTAWINTAPGSGTDISDAENEAGNLILLHAGPKGGFTQGGQLAATGSYLVSDNIHTIITEPLA